MRSKNIQGQVSSVLVVGLIPIVALAVQSPSGSTGLDGIFLGKALGFQTGLYGAFVGTRTLLLTFFPDGKVYMGIPEPGLEGLNRTSYERKEPHLWGVYRRAGAGQWEARWPAYDWVGIQQRGRNLAVDGWLLEPVATLEGARLTGAYSNVDVAELRRVDPRYLDTYRVPIIEFDAAGNFVDSDLIGSIAYIDPSRITLTNPGRTVAPGTGGYRIGRNTLFLHYSDGRKVQVSIFASSPDAQAQPGSPQIFINRVAVTKVK